MCVCVFRTRDSVRWTKFLLLCWWYWWFYPYSIHSILTLHILITLLWVFSRRVSVGSLRKNIEKCCLISMKPLRRFVASFFFSTFCDKWGIAMLESAKEHSEVHLAGFLDVHASLFERVSSFPRCVPMCVFILYFCDVDFLVLTNQTCLNYLGSWIETAKNEDSHGKWMNLSFLVDYIRKDNNNRNIWTHGISEERVERLNSLSNSE